MVDEHLTDKNYVFDVVYSATNIYVVIIVTCYVENRPLINDASRRFVDGEWVLFFCQNVGSVRTPFIKTIELTALNGLT